MWGDEETERVPDFVGQTMDDIIKQQYPYHVEWPGEGDQVIEQLPKAGELIKQDGVVHLYLSN